MELCTLHYMSLMPYSMPPQFTVVTVGISDYSIHNMSAASFTLELTEGTLQEGLEVEVQLTVELVQPGTQIFRYIIIV